MSKPLSHRVPVCLQADSAITVGFDVYGKVSARVRDAVRPEVLSERVSRTRDVLILKVQDTLTLVKEQGVVGTAKLTTAEALKLPRTGKPTSFNCFELQLLHILILENAPNLARFSPPRPFSSMAQLGASQARLTLCRGPGCSLRTVRR